jgi:predicted metal-dependent hydrolase
MVAWVAQLRAAVPRGPSSLGLASSITRSGLSTEPSGRRKPVELSNIRQERLRSYLNALKARWGSCHRNGQLVFNWPIIKAPPSSIDDVVIHELCHLVHANHSPEFWHLLQHPDGDSAAHRQWLLGKEGQWW